MSEPPELTGEPKKLKNITEAQRQFGKVVEEFKDKEKTKETLPALDKFIAEHPEYSDAYFIRANCNLCILDSPEYSSILKAVDTAISTNSLPTSETFFDNLKDAYSLRGKLRFVTGRYRDAIGDLEHSMKEDLSSADTLDTLPSRHTRQAGFDESSRGDLRSMSVRATLRQRIAALGGVIQ